MRPKLTLKPRVDPNTKPKLDPAKVSLSEQMRARYVDRGGRYIMQQLIVSYGERELTDDFTVVKTSTFELSRTWVDVPLVPEGYFS